VTPDDDESRMSIRYVSLVILISVGISSLSLHAADVDHRFEGIWKGIETLKVNGNIAQRAEAPVRKQTIIAIGDGGKTIAVVEGLYPGRYAVSPSWVQSWRGVSGGNTLVFAMINRPTTILSRDVCKLMLSSDGTTLTETGDAALPREGGDLRGTATMVVCHIDGTFRRQAKK
jgi:hypothetical protein